MVYVNHIILTPRGVKRNRRFLKLLYNCDDLEEPIRWFDILDCSKNWARQRDPDMTLDRFVKLIERNSHITLQVNYPHPDEISYCAAAQPRGEPTYFAWLECPYTENNFDRVSCLYRAAFNLDISAEPSEEFMRKRYEMMKQGR